MYELATKTDNKERQETLEDWKRTGGVLVMGYSLFRILVSYNGRSRKAKQTYATALIDPGELISRCCCLHFVISLSMYMKNKRLNGVIECFI